ncbi:MAG TPA: hypothetical protein DER07_07485 [Armatimonadetes bacterium]|nr:flagellar biosynthesis anti-sigma factor FlgM [Armatimonadota bacterium]HCE00871.1 hypothetical protein [Armatimonadota bacterium]
MRISDEQVKKVLASAKEARSSESAEAYYHPVIGQISKPVAKEEDVELVRELTEKVKQMPDREDLIADLRARIAAGQYNPSGEEIAEAMIRRAIADRIR